MWNKGKLSLIPNTHNITKKKIRIFFYSCHLLIKKIRMSTWKWMSHEILYLSIKLFWKQEFRRLVCGTCFFLCHHSVPWKKENSPSEWFVSFRQKGRQRAYSFVCMSLFNVMDCQLRNVLLKSLYRMNFRKSYEFQNLCVFFWNCYHGLHPF